MYLEVIKIYSYNVFCFVRVLLNYVSIDYLISEDFYKLKLRNKNKSR